MDSSDSRRNDDQHATATAALTRSIGPACHEMRSPLSVIFGFAKMLEGDQKLPEPQRDWARHMVNAAAQLDHQLEWLSQLGRVASGRIEPRAEQVHIAELLSGVVPTEAVDFSDEAHHMATVTVDSALVESALRAVVQWFDDHITFPSGHGVNVGVFVGAETVDLRFTTVEPSAQHAVSLDVQLDEHPPTIGLGWSETAIELSGGTIDRTGNAIVVTLPL